MQNENKRIVSRRKDNQKIHTHKKTSGHNLTCNNFISYVLAMNIA